MTKTELIERMTRLSQSHCTQVAELQFYGGEGPFLFAMDEEDGKPKFFCFSFADADEFLQVRRLPFDTLLARCLSGEIEDGKTVAAVLKAKLLGL